MSELTDIAMRVSHLSKMFKSYRKPADMFWELLSSKPRYTPYWALCDVSFEVKRGQVVGLIGRNGAGKSTLLKILTGTLDKTSGDVEVYGRISSILELGTGFNGEYTGRENIYLGGLIMGLSREEVKHKLDWIIEFSELGDFIDQPFKTYSTGMQSRLTFSTAVCIDPDILIVDEALSVGDARFQRKCFGKFDEFRQSGQTILLVSHDMNSVTTFCDHAIFLEGGRIIDQGEPQRITKVYYQVLFCEEETAPAPSQAATSTASHEAAAPEQQAPLSVSTNPEMVVAQPASVARSDEPPDLSGHRLTTAVAQPVPIASVPLHSQDERAALRLAALHQLGLTRGFDQDNAHQMRMGNQKAEILDFGILGESGNRTTLLTSGAKYIFLMRAVFYEDVDDVVAGFLIRNLKGIDMYGTSTVAQKIPMGSQHRGGIIEVRLQVAMWLTNGTYFLTVAIADPNAEADVQYDLHYDALEFAVGMQEGIFTTSVVDLNGQFAVKRLSAVLAESRGGTVYPVGMVE